MMISLELWRARIGTFNNRRCFGCPLSSLSSSLSFDSAHFRSHSGSTHASREESPSVAQPLTSPSSSSLATKEQSQAFSSTINRSVLTTSRLISQSVSFSKSSSCFIRPTSGVSLCRSLLRDAVITLLIAVISQLLMVAGDIESNPGPKHGGEVYIVFLHLPAVYKFDSVYCM